MTWFAKICIYICVYISIYKLFLYVCKKIIQEVSLSTKNKLINKLFTPTEDMKLGYEIKLIYLSLFFSVAIGTFCICLILFQNHVI